MAGRHAKVADARKRKVRWAYVGAFIIAATVALAGVRWIGGFAAGCDDSIELIVDAAPAIAPALTEYVEQELPKFEGDARCLRPEIRSTEPSAAAKQLASDDALDRPDIWIPDSTMWFERAKAAPDAGRSIATSPVVLATTESVAGENGWPERNPTWSELVGGSSVAGTPEPSTDIGAVFALMGIDGLKWNEIEQTKAIQGLTKSTFAEADDPYGHLPHGDADPTVATFPSSEQAVLLHNFGVKAGSERSVVASYPDTTTPWLDYPSVVLGGLEKERHEAAKALERAFESPAAVEILAKHGFRTPAGKLTGAAVADKRVRGDAGEPVRAPEEKSANVVLQQWATFTSAARMVVALDVSGSMAQAVPGTKFNRMQIAVSTVSEALKLLRPNTQLAFWEFSTERDGTKPYREIAPLQPMIRHVKDGLPDRIDDEITGPEGFTGLYDTTLAAFEKVQSGWDPAMLNLVLVVTDGQNEHPDGITKAKLLSELKGAVDEDKPTKVIFVGLGTEVDGKELSDIAKATAGQVHLSKDVKNARELFFTILRGLSSAP